jgi:hypothetical protein
MAWNHLASSMRPARASAVAVTKIVGEAPLASGFHPIGKSSKFLRPAGRPADENDQVTAVTLWSHEETMAKVGVAAATRPESPPHKGSLALSDPRHR